MAGLVYVWEEGEADIIMPSQQNFQLENVPSLVLKAMHLRGPVLCNFHSSELSEQALGGGIPLGYGIVVEDRTF